MAREKGEGAETVTVFAPNPNYKGTRLGVTFKDGEGSIAKSDRAALAAFRRWGYGVGKKPKAEASAPERPVDAREAARITVGTPLRDAAVDPKKGDFLAPVNAGKADPHGPEVVSPEIHGPSPKGIAAGDVHVDDPKAQDAHESELAEAVLIQGAPKPEAIAATADDAPVPTKKELLARAAELGIEMPKRATNAEIAAAIAKADGEPS